MTMEDLRDFDIDPESGFLPGIDPLERLPPRFDAWERAVSRVTPLMLAGALDKAVGDLPTFETSALDSREELERAMLLLSILGGAYVWGRGDPATTLPAALAVPWCVVADELGRPPSVAHASVVLRNWRRLDPGGERGLDNLRTLSLFSGSSDEQWFYLIPAAIEARGAEALGTILRMRTAVAAERVEPAGDGLERIANVISDLTAILDRTAEHCDPYIFYHRVRPFLTAWPDPGLIYEGVADAPRQLAGGSAAQSSLIQTIDAALGVSHEDERSQPFLQAMRRYMPEPHRRFIEAIEQGPSVRDWALSEGARYPQMRERYGACVSELERFRTTHFELAVRYITKQAPAPDTARGTGGTDLRTFLRTTRDETRDKLIE